MELLPVSDSTEDLCSLRSNSSSDSGRYRPSPRYSHCSAIFNNHLYLWGGMLEDLPDYTSEELLELFYLVETLDLKTGDWEQHVSTGSPPLGLYASSCTVLGEKIYFFGGYCSHENRYSDSLHTLDPSIFEWNQLAPINPNCSPMSKAWSEIVGFKDGVTDLLCIFGGLGKLPQWFSEQQFTPDEADPTFGWTNEIHIFSPEEASWVVPTVVGESPPPCDAFTMTSIAANKAAVYGGGTGKCMARQSDMYLLEMELKQMIWSRIQSPGPQPLGRRLHGAACISGSLLGQEEPLLFTGGGMGGKRKALGDYWIINFKTGNWEKIIIPGSCSVVKRMGHTICAITMGDGCAWIVLVGGVNQWDKTKPEHAQPFCSSRIFKIVLELVLKTNGQLTITRIPTSKHHEKHMERLGQQQQTTTQVEHVDDIKIPTIIQPIDKGEAESQSALTQPNDAIWTDAMTKTWLEVEENLLNAVSQLDVAIDESCQLSDEVNQLSRVYSDESAKQPVSGNVSSSLEMNHKGSVVSLEDEASKSSENSAALSRVETRPSNDELKLSTPCKEAVDGENGQEIMNHCMPRCNQGVGVANLQEVEYLKEQIKILNTERDWLDKQVQSLRQDLSISQEYIQKYEQRASIAEQQALDNAYYVDILKHRLQAEEEKAKMTLVRAEEVERRLLLAEHHVHFHPVTWMIQRDQIELTQTEIGRGHRAVVKIARFRQTIVAAKCLQDVVLVKDNIQQFSREMYTAALLHHPNIVRFIGAVSTGEAIILIELMPTSLRKELQKLPLSLSVVRMITRDVAQGLNYLHQWKPSPIIHRGVSSSNVLLEPLGTSNWRAKLSDHGATSFLQQTADYVQDTCVYSSPESEQIERHSTKMDIYSLGALLAEMCVNQYPPQTHDDKVKLIHTIQWPTLKAVALQCTNIEPSERPSVAAVISNL